ncbi:inorganic phosphate transporter [Ectopseudomonas mendocina]|uniref:Phosphate transporter n=1 Tax=Ectopseudomonas mendocina TaxID=300 RepID=A0ABZ2RAM0_ECTME
MLSLFSTMDAWLIVSLVVAVTFVLAFEFINGFHDTANAVATVIYTKAMTPNLAVFCSGVFNFLGVLLGGVGVAYAIVHLLPVDLLINVNTGQGLVMVFSLLAAAILWNLGTWFFGIPASSSHTLIGSILGVGLANALITDISAAEGVNWQKAADIGMSLLFSPLAGFAVAALLLIALKLWKPLSTMHSSPVQRIEEKGKKHPPFWNRMVLVTSAMAVSFVHGSNDGQKGIGLIMLVLIGIVPAHFAVDLEATGYEISRTRDAAVHLGDFYHRNSEPLSEYLALGKGNGSDLPKQFHCDPQQTEATLASLLTILNGVHSYEDIPPAQRVEMRRYLLCLDDAARKVSKLDVLPDREKSDLEKLRKDLTSTTEYVPFWVVLAVALSLGLGTMVGWKRVVLTVGEKIGRGGMTYAQGMSAQVTAAVAIGMANVFSLPVSTTHVLSSGVAGTMVANRSGLQSGTVRNILLAWALTLPVAMTLAAGLYLAVTFLFLR